MEPGRLALLSVGAVAIALGLAVLTRRTPGDPALYRRRIAGTMLLAFGPDPCPVDGPDALTIRTAPVFRVITSLLIRSRFDAPS